MPEFYFENNEDDSLKELKDLPKNSVFVSIVGTDYFWHPKDDDLSTGIYVARKGIMGAAVFELEHATLLLKQLKDKRLKIVKAKELLEKPLEIKKENLN